MKKTNLAKFIFGFLGIATFSSLVGTVSGTLAWYAYATRATLSYSGTSVLNTVQLQIGIASDVEIDTYEQDEMIEEEYDGIYYYFAPVGTDLTSESINKYLEANGYATNYLVPVTSGVYQRGAEFSLKDSPNSMSSHNNVLADKSYYAKIPFVFRVMRSSSASINDYVPNQELWITDAQVKASSLEDGNIFKSIRMFIDRDENYEDDFILNPSAENKGSTKVGGLLDLTKDGYYDFDKDGNEIIYGDFDENKVNISSVGYSGPNQIMDVNGSGSSEHDTFTAKHYQNVLYYNDFADDAMKVADYESFSSIAPEKDETSGTLRNKDLAHPTSVCKTGGALEHYMGKVTFTIYLEGWDFSVIDQELEHLFDMGLQFEINQVRNG